MTASSITTIQALKASIEMQAEDETAEQFIYREEKEVLYIDLVKQGSMSTLQDSAPNETSDLPFSSTSESNQYSETVIELDSLPPSSAEEPLLPTKYPLEFNDYANERTFDPFTKSGKR